jgi:hypothetical protein
MPIRHFALALGSDYFPMTSADSGPTFGAGLVSQPSAACSQPAGLQVTSG